MSDPSETDCTCPRDTWGGICDTHGACPVHGAPDIDEVTAARYRLAFGLTRLPYADGLSIPITISDYSQLNEVQFLTAIAAWTDRYSSIVALARGTANGMADELAQLREQRKSIRAFLGTD